MSSGNQLNISIAIYFYCCLIEHVLHQLAKHIQTTQNNHTVTEIKESSLTKAHVHCIAMKQKVFTVLVIKNKNFIGDMLKMHCF